MQDLRMPNMLLQALRSWGGTQESVTSLAGGEVTFQPRVAMRVSTLIAQGLRPERCYENLTFLQCCTIPTGSPLDVAGAPPGLGCRWIHVEHLQPSEV